MLLFLLWCCCMVIECRSLNLFLLCWVSKEECCCLFRLSYSKVVNYLVNKRLKRALFLTVECRLVYFLCYFSTGPDTKGRCNTWCNRSSSRSFLPCWDLHRSELGYRNVGWWLCYIHRFVEWIESDLNARLQWIVRNGQRLHRLTLHDNDVLKMESFQSHFWKVLHTDDYAVITMPNHTDPQKWLKTL